MSESFEAQKRSKNNIVHVFDGQKVRKHLLTGEAIDVSVCGSCDKEDAPARTYDVTRDEVLDNEYLIRDGDIIGKLCGNCSTTLTSPKFKND